MSNRRAVFLMLLLTLAGLWRPATAAESTKPPALMVLLVFDQMRGDYLSRWGTLFGEGGFRRLCEDGAWFTNAHYPYAITMTAAGHSSIATGSSPDTHGIVGNEWWDKERAKGTTAVDSDRWILRTWSTQPVPMQEPGSAGSPEKQEAATIGDVLKAKYPDSKIVSFSVKERSAILMAGKKGDAVYSLDSGTGLFGTSSYYGDRMHTWVRDYNDTRPADRWFGKSWNKLREDLDYEAYSGPDDAAGEGTGIGQGRTFPHPFSPDSAKPDKKYYEAVSVSPMANELLVELALQAIKAEKLGQRGTPDLLCISFSSNDLVGHNWGPDSQEILDVTLRSDRDVARLLRTLDETVGEGNYVVAVSSDHGVCPLMENLHAQGKDAGRLFAKEVMSAASKYLDSHYKVEKPAPWFLGGANTWIALNHETIRSHQLEVREVENVLTDWLEKQPGIAFSRSLHQLEKTTAEETPFLEEIRRSIYPGRTGDIIAVPKEYYYFAFALTGTSHGTPYPYDTHVPVLFFGKGIEAGMHEELAAPQVVAPVFCRLLGSDPAATMKEKVPDGLLRRSP